MQSPFFLHGALCHEPCTVPPLCAMSPFGVVITSLNHSQVTSVLTCFGVGYAFPTFFYVGQASPQQNVNKDEQHVVFSEGGSQQ